MKRVVIFAFLSVFLISYASAGSQELVYGEPFQVDYSGPNHTYPGVVVFNGVDHGVFFSYRGTDDLYLQIYFRRLDPSGKPYGPQRLIMTSPGHLLVAAAEWDGSAYIVAVYGWLSNEGVYLLRVSKDGKVLARADFDNYSYGSYLSWIPLNSFLKVVGDDFYFCFSEGQKPLGKRRVLLIHGPKSLKGRLTTTTLPKGNLVNTTLFGMTFDTDGFLALLGEQSSGEAEVEKALLLQIDFNGKVVGQPFDLEETITPSVQVAGPAFFGGGYMILYTERDGNNYHNRSLVIDWEGKTVSGANDLGQAPTPFLWLNPAWNGSSTSSFAIAVHSAGKFGYAFFMFNAKGKFLVDPIYFVGNFNDVVWGQSQAFTGRATTFVYSVIKQGTYLHHLYSNQVSLPAGIKKPQIVFFKAGAKNLGGNKRAVVWSAAGSKTVLMKGKGVKLKKLRPVDCALVEVTGKKLGLTLIAKGPGGKAKKRLVIKP